MPVAALWPVPAVVTFDPDAAKAPLVGEDDFLATLRALLPPGKAWTRDPDATLTALLRGLAAGFASLQARASEVLKDAFPTGTVELLPEWEATLGLPDPCIGPEALVDERRAQVVARLTNPGGQSVGYFVWYAGQLGYPITITEFAPSRFGQVFGEPFYASPLVETPLLYGGLFGRPFAHWGDEAWPFVWQVDSPTLIVRPLHYGEPFGEPFADWDASPLACELQRFSPGHTKVVFAYH